MSLITHAERELGIVFDGTGDSDDVDYQNMVKRAVMELIKVFSEQGHSGFSAPYVARLFKTLANYETLTPIQGTDNEWVVISPDNQQNIRNSKIFKKFRSDGSSYCTYLDSIILRSANGSNWSGGVRDKDGNYVSHKNFHIKAFPFTPKTFYVDVIDVENEKGEFCDFKMVDESQLDAISEYYDRV